MGDPEQRANTAFVDGVRRFAIDVSELDIDLIDRINPFGEVYAILAARSAQSERSDARLSCPGLTLKIKKIAARVNGAVTAWVTARELSDASRAIIRSIPDCWVSASMSCCESEPATVRYQHLALEDPCSPPITGDAAGDGVPTKFDYDPLRYPAEYDVGAIGVVRHG